MYTRALVTFVLVVLMLCCIPHASAQSTEPVAFKKAVITSVTTYTQPTNGTYSSVIDYVVQLWVGAEIAAFEVEFNVHAAVTGAVQIVYELKNSFEDQGYVWRENYNVQTGNDYVLKVVFPKPLISSTPYLRIYCMGLGLYLATPSETTTNLYDPMGEAVGSAAYTLKFAFMPDEGEYIEVGYDSFTPRYANSSHLMLEYSGKLEGYYEIVQVEAGSMFSLASNYLVAGDGYQYFIALPNRTFTFVGNLFLTFFNVYAVVGCGEDSLTLFSAPISFTTSNNLSGSRFLLYTGERASEVVAYYSGATRRAKCVSNVTRLYFPEGVSAVYTFQCDGENYTVRDLAQHVIDYGLVSRTSKTFAVTLQYGKTYVIEIDGMYSYVVGADSNYVKGLFKVRERPRYGVYTFYAVKEGDTGTVYFNSTIAYSGEGTISVYVWNQSRYTLILEETFEGPSHTLTIYGLGDGEYIAKVRYGTVSATTPFVVAQTHDASEMLGYVSVNGAILPVAYLVFSLMCVVFAALFSQGNAEVGAFAVCFFFLFLSIFNLVPFNNFIYNLVYAVILAAVFEIMARRRREGV